MITLWLNFKLRSDATFGRGDGVAGLVDAEVQHDAYGCPYLFGRTLKGLLREECSNLLFALAEAGQAERWVVAANRLFGLPGSSHQVRSLLHVGDAMLPEDLRAAIAAAVQRKELTRSQVLESLTAIRHQTAVSAITGAPQAETLRTMRVILRETPFCAELTLETPSNDDQATENQAELALLAACVKALHRAGAGRNRGRGELAAQLCDTGQVDKTERYFAYFATQLLPKEVQP